MNCFYVDQLRFVSSCFRSPIILAMGSGASVQPATSVTNRYQILACRYRDTSLEEFRYLLSIPGEPRRTYQVADHEHPPPPPPPPLQIVSRPPARDVCGLGTVGA